MRSCPLLVFAGVWSGCASSPCKEISNPMLVTTTPGEDVQRLTLCMPGRAEHTLFERSDKTLINGFASPLSRKELHSKHISISAIADLDSDGSQEFVLGFILKEVGLREYGHFRIAKVARSGAVTLSQAFGKRITSAIIFEAAGRRRVFVPDSESGDVPGEVIWWNNGVWVTQRLPEQKPETRASRQQKSEFDQVSFLVTFDTASKPQWVQSLNVDLNDDGTVDRVRCADAFKGGQFCRLYLAGNDDEPLDVILAGRRFTVLKSRCNGFHEISVDSFLSEVLCWNGLQFEPKPRFNESQFEPAPKTP